MELTLRFVFTMPMASFKNNLVQEIIAEFKVDGLNQLLAHLDHCKWGIQVEQFYQDKGKWVSRGPLLINKDLIGKVKVFVEDLNR